MWSIGYFHPSISFSLVKTIGRCLLRKCFTSFAYGIRGAAAARAVWQMSMEPESCLILSSHGPAMHGVLVLVVAERHLQNCKVLHEVELFWSCLTDTFLLQVVSLHELRLLWAEELFEIERNQRKISGLIWACPSDRGSIKVFKSCSR